MSSSKYNPNLYSKPYMIVHNSSQNDNLYTIYLINSNSCPALKLTEMSDIKTVQETIENIQTNMPENNKSLPILIDKYYKELFKKHLSSELNIVDTTKYF